MLKNWSLDTKFFLAYFVAMHALLLTGVTPTATSQLAAAGIMLLVFIVWSLRHRKAMGWRWPGFKLSGIYSIFMSIMVLAVLVLAVAGTVIPEGQREILFTEPFNSLEILKTAWQAIRTSDAPFDPRITPALLICLGIVIFLALSGLQLVTYSREQFLEQCSPPKPPDQESAK